MDWWTWAILVLASLGFMMLSRFVSMQHLDPRRTGMCFLLLVLLLQYCDNKPMGCAMPPRNDLEISLTFCSFRELPDLSAFKSYENMIKLNVSHNDLQTLDPDLFKFNLKLAYLDLSYNSELGKDFQGTDCIIKSESLKQLNLAYTGFGLIQPESICAPNIRNINLVGVNKCEQTQELFKKKRPLVRITCGGSVPVAISEGTTLSPLNTQSSTISGPTTTTGDSTLHGPTSMANSSGVTTQQPVTAAPTSAEGEPDKDLTHSTTGPNNSEGTHEGVGVWVWVVIVIVVVVLVLVLVGLVVVILRCFPHSECADWLRSWGNSFMALRNIDHVRSRGENNNANTRVNSEKSLEVNESDTEQASFLNQKN